MTNDELERVMNFLIEREVNIRDVLQRQQQLMGKVIESQTTLTATVLRIAEAADASFSKQDE